MGVLFGLWEAIVFIEGQKLLLLPLIFLILGGTWLLNWRRSQLRIVDFFAAGPMPAFVAGLLPAILVGLAIYAMITGGFAEPSEFAARWVWIFGYS